MITLQIFDKHGGEMKNINITDEILEKLGFGEYDDIDGISGTRRLNFESGGALFILEILQTEYFEAPTEQERFFYHGYLPSTDEIGRYVVNTADILRIVSDNYPWALEEIRGKIEQLMVKE